MPLSRALQYFLAFCLLLAACGDGGPEHEVNLGDQRAGGVVDAKYGIGDDKHIVALRDVVAPDGTIVARAGERGGWVQHHSSLSHSGSAWVGPDARVEDDAQVFGDAQVYGNAVVSGDALVYGSARVHGSAWVYGNAQVFDSAQVYEKAEVSGNAMVFDSSYSKDHTGEGIFDAGSLARLIWSNSETAGEVVVKGQTMSINSVDQRRSSLEQVPYVGDTRDESADVELSKRNELKDVFVALPENLQAAPMPASVFGTAVVTENSRIWGGSEVGSGTIEGDSWVSGRTDVFGARVCGDFWLNNYKGGGYSVIHSCSEPFGATRHIVLGAFGAGLLLVGLSAVGVVRRRARGKSLVGHS